MKKAMCHYSLHRRWKAEQWNADRLAQEVRALGVEGVDFHAGLMGTATGAVELIRAAVARHGLTLTSLSLGNNFNQEKPEDFRTQVETVKTWIRVAAELKAPVSRIFGGHLAADKRGDPVAAAPARQRILEGLGQVVREAELHGLVLALENHGGLPCSGEEQAEVIRAINSPSLRATIDVGNYMACGQEATDGTRAAAPLAAYVHFKDFKKVPDPAKPWGWTTEACTVGDGAVDHAGCLRELRAAGYNGVIALEYEGKEDEVTGVPRSVKFMDQVMQSYL